MAVEGHCGGVFQHCDALYFLDGEAVDRPLYSVDEYQYVSLACGLYATDIECRATAFLALEACILEGVESEEPAIEGVCQTDGRCAP